MAAGARSDADADFPLLETTPRRYSLPTSAYSTPMCPSAPIALTRADMRVLVSTLRL